MSSGQRRSRFALVALVMVVSAGVGTTMGVRGPTARAVETPPSIVLILTDDQRADTLRYMPIVRHALGDHGVTFTNAYAVNPVCCPSRSTILTGLYSHTTGVYTNDLGGGFAAFEDESTIATWLHDAGYRTGLFGKYLNGYETEYTPPGWDRWFAAHGSGNYYNYSVTSDGTIVQYGHDRADYGTTVIGRETISFIQDTPAEQPLFAYVSVPAPHEPAIPAPGDEDTFGTIGLWRPPSYNEADVKDKPSYIREHRWLEADRRKALDRTRARQLRTLPAVDSLVGDVVDALAQTGRLENTMIVFASDNGVLWGEHRWESKDVPYEESIAIPLVVRYDAMIPKPRRDDNLVTNVDFAPTFAEAAGVTTPYVEGLSILGLLLDPSVSLRNGFLIEHMASHGGNAVPSYCGYHTKRYVLVRYNARDKELYDLKRDPWQRENVYESKAFSAVRNSLNERLVDACQPITPGVVLDD